MARNLLIGAAAAALLLAGVAVAPAPAQAQAQPQLLRLRALCDQGYKPACIRFGYLLALNRRRWAEWRRLHPDWWWWERW
jgi:hypothetical protein